MKTLSFLLFVCFALVSLSACEKQEDLNPELVSRVTGDYPFAQVVSNGRTYPISQTNLSGQASIERKSSSSVKLAWRYTSGRSSYSGSYTGMTLTDVGNGDVEFRYSNNVVATVSDGTLYLNVDDSNGESMTFIGVR